MTELSNTTTKHFLQQIIEQDIANELNGGQVVTRFPPEPNGYLHIGHAKSICLNFSIAQRYGGQCNLRFDDTNPEKESQEYIDSIIEDVKWLGFQWSGDIRYTSNYFQQLYEWALLLIEKGLAYVDHLDAEAMRTYRGTLTEPGQNSPFRDRSVEENLQWFSQMKQGLLEEGACVLRAKIDMAAANINMRDPVIYRIRHARHHQSGEAWKIYPSYDFAHGQSDALEGVTHSLCTLEFEDHRPLYDWFIEHLPVPLRSRQYEFARLNLNYTVTSKRKLKQLVDEQLVRGWDDPRLPTISGLRRRGYTPASLRNFCEMIGITRSNGVVDMAMLEASIRNDLETNAPRAMCVHAPIKVTLINYEENEEEVFHLPCHPKDDQMGKRAVSFGKYLYIEREDFAEVAPRKWKRLALGEAVRLRGAYVIRCEEVVKDQEGRIVELRCTYDPATKGVNPEGYKANGVIHWVDARHSMECEVRLYDRLFTESNPEADKERSFLDHINPDSLVVLTGCKAELSLESAEVGESYQFERQGYYCVDKDSSSQLMVFNRTVTLKDSWGKIQQS